MKPSRNFDRLSRRDLLKTGATATCAAAVSVKTQAADPPLAPPQPAEPVITFETHAKGIRILPGQWRPHYPWEQIAWVSPPWRGQDYVWLDFPEAIFTRQGMLFLSHVNPQIPAARFPDLPAVKWRTLPEGLAYERELPNGVAFGGQITRAPNGVDLELFIRNGSQEPLTNITLQTCCLLRAIREFAAYTGANKFVHVPDQGWIAWDQAAKLQQARGQYRLGWRSGPPLADLPIAVTTSSAAERLMAFTWLADTLSIVHNPHHPCVHADPMFPDLPPGRSATIRGKLIFFEGSLRDFDQALQAGLLPTIKPKP